MEDEQSTRCVLLEWAKQWRAGNAQCPWCGIAEFDLVDNQSDGRMRYETFACKAESCRARWKVEFQEVALVVLRGDVVNGEDWIELQ